jgi:protein involved in polysaccharide export with SLBB domain
MTMLEAIGEAGGFTPQAVKKKVSLIHKADGRSQTFNLDPDTLRRHPAPSFFLRPGDMIQVPADLLE